MEIPECYDPVYQEERRQAAMDSFVEDLPVCGCCKRSVYPHSKFYELKVEGNRIIVCQDCKSDLDMSEMILEE